MNDTLFRPVACRRCGVTILAGQTDGLSWRVDTYAVPVEDATTLKTYGVTPLVLDVGPTGLRADVWAPTQHPLDTPGRYLVAPHVCGSAHAQRSTKEGRT